MIGQKAARDGGTTIRLSDKRQRETNIVQRLEQDYRIKDNLVYNEMN